MACLHRLRHGGLPSQQSGTVKPRLRPYPSTPDQTVQSCRRAACCAGCAGLWARWDQNQDQVSARLCDQLLLVVKPCQACMEAQVWHERTKTTEQGKR